MQQPSLASRSYHIVRDHHLRNSRFSPHCTRRPRLLVGYSFPRARAHLIWSRQPASQLATPAPASRVALLASSRLSYAQLSGSRFGLRLMLTMSPPATVCKAQAFPDFLHGDVALLICRASQGHNLPERKPVSIWTSRTCLLWAHSTHEELCMRVEATHIRMADVSCRSILLSSPVHLAPTSASTVRTLGPPPSFHLQTLRANQPACVPSVSQRPLLALPWRRPCLTPAVP